MLDVVMMASERKSCISLYVSRYTLMLKFAVIQRNRNFVNVSHRVASCVTTTWIFGTLLASSSPDSVSHKKPIARLVDEIANHTPIREF
jgi:hypothetical protein